ncbi:unnamed protein product [Didymodactylos carnosus]|uniref:Uncharacterized protein n=1 Tax=Didymodactylos carnosus TaxID=1234261 RepID=A0A814ABE2_9BILA|nr:unnamed protein product [Didymodactylos carnosus]CAF3692265.1 unnamed protein product [Didymodactylos carnosus]
MRNVGKFGSIAFALLTIACLFHLLAMGYPNWKTITCSSGCENQTAQEWTTSISNRCYATTLQNFSFNSAHPLFATLCLPNQYLYPKNKADLYLCSLQMYEHPRTACALERHTPECYCAYSTSTQLQHQQTRQYIVAILLNLASVSDLRSWRYCSILEEQ